MDKMAEPRSDLLAIEDAPETGEMEEFRSSDLAESPSMMAEADHEGHGSEDDPVTKMQKALHPPICEKRAKASRTLKQGRRSRATTWVPRQNLRV